MSMGSLLNTDVKSLRAMALRGVGWWVGQIEQMLPAALRHARRAPRQLVIWTDGTMRVVRKRASATVMPRSGSRVALAVPTELAFLRTLQLPRMTGSDLRRVVELEAERLSPLPPSELLIGVDAPSDNGADKTMQVDVAVLPQRVAEQAIDAADAAGLAITGFGLISGPGRQARFDFMPALRERLLVPTRRSAGTIWWTLVGALFLINFVVMIVRDEQSVARLATAAEEQGPAVSAARAIQARAGEFDRLSRDVTARRAASDPLRALAVVSAALPAGAWVQRFTMTGPTVRLTGYRSGNADVVTALRRHPRIAAVRSNGEQPLAPSPMGQPFDVVARLRTAP